MNFGKAVELDKAIKKLDEMRKISPFFIEPEIKEIIETIGNSRPVVCGDCRHIEYIENDCVWYCNLYKIAKSFDGFCDMGENR